MEEKQKNSKQMKRTKKTLILGAVSFASLIFLAWSFLSGHSLPFSAPLPQGHFADGKLTVAFLNVGQGDAIFVRGPDGTTVLFDGGPDRSLLQRLGEVMPLGQRSVDMIVITNPDKDHIGGFIPLLQTMKIGTVLEPGTSSVSATYHTLKDEIAEAQKQDGARVIVARQGMRFPIGDGAEIDILFPDRDVSDWKTNDGSIIARITFASTSVLLTGDSTKKTEALLGQLAPVDILKIGHHGSRTSTGQAFIAQLRPKWAVISAGFENRYGHPHPQTLEILNKFGVQTLITFEKGTIVFRSNGKNWLEPEFIH